MRYNVQCISGHVFTAEEDSELEKRCIEREQQGYLDALCVTAVDCEECQYEANKRSSQYE